MAEAFEPKIVAFLCNWFSYAYAEAAANVLTHAAIDPIACIPEYKICAVKVKSQFAVLDPGVGKA